MKDSCSERDQYHQRSSQVSRQTVRAFRKALSKKRENPPVTCLVTALTELSELDFYTSIHPKRCIDLPFLFLKYAIFMFYVLFMKVNVLLKRINKCPTERVLVW